MSRKRVALIAGGGELPQEFLRSAHEKGIEVTILKIKGEAEKGFLKYGFSSHDIYMTKLTDVINIMKQENLKELVMLGYVKHTNLLKDIKFDVLTVKTLLKAKDMRAVSILSEVMNLLVSKGIKVLPSTYLMDNLLAEKGVIAGVKPGPKQIKDIELGFEMAKKISGLDIGQTVVVKNGNVVAVEAIEGTDKCIERGAQIAGKGFIVVKTSRPKQDMRYDVPVIGLRTTELVAKYKGAGIVVEAGKTFVMDKPGIVKIAKKNRMFILGR